MYLVINTSTQMIMSSSDRPVNNSSLDGVYIIDIPNEQYQEEMVGSYWDATNEIHIPQPTPFHEWDGNDWSDARPDEVKWIHIRGRRDDALTSTDWTQVPDNKLTEEEKTAYTTWRQTLRDLPADYPDPDDAEEQLPIILAAEPTV